MKRHELTNEEWERIESLMPPKFGSKGGRPRKDDRAMLNAMLWIARTSCQWREITKRYGKWEAVYARFRKWQGNGLLERLFQALGAEADLENLCAGSRSREGAKDDKKKQ
ncbi:MAG: transposase [Acidaminococcales bacterium]|jgi:transposase|nr:transposase [Acidaminococcales bacterium]